MRGIVRILMALSFLLLLFTAWATHQADTGKTKVFVLEIRNNIDPRMSRYVDLALTQATELNADIIILDMDTYGGAVNDANDIRTQILAYEKPVWVYINNDAASAGALISIACDSIYMVPGANIGAATVVNGADGSQAPDKYQSYFRSIMRSTAEETGRDPDIAEGMVDDRVEIEGVTEAGKVITFTTSEAIANGFCEREVASIRDVLEKNEVTNYELINYELSFTEQIIAFFLNPVISGLLILVITGGIFFELQTPGVGFPLAAAGLALILYTTPFYLNGLAENWEIAMFFVGLALIALEVFVIPGFGVAGIAGIACTFGALIFFMVANDNFNFDNVPTGNLTRAITVVAVGVFGAIILLFVLGYRLMSSNLFSKVALIDTQRKEEGYTSTNYTSDMVKKEGVAITILRPSGRVEIEDEIYDAYTRGEYIEIGEKIVVTSNEGTSLQVKKKKMNNTEDISPESFAISGGHRPSDALNSIKPPIYQTSTFQFNTAEEGKAFFEQAAGQGSLEERNNSLIYTRLNHPNAITAEKRLARLDGAEDAAFFSSGMAAISNTILTFCHAGDLLLLSSPLYGGTDAFIKKHLVDYDVQWLEFEPGANAEEINLLVANHPRKDQLKMIYLETPANPTLSLTDISMLDQLRKEWQRKGEEIIIAVDNTYMGPIFQKPLSHGADINLYSATKYLGGHSDLIAGAASGREQHIKLIKSKRTLLGSLISPFTAWLLSRSMETVNLRMEKQAETASILAKHFKKHPKISCFYHLDLLPEQHKDQALFKKQYTSGGAMMAFEVKGGEAEAFRFLNALRIAHLAISLGSTETLASHPYTMSSSNMAEEDRLKNSITPALIRVSVGLENVKDLIKDFEQALAQV